MNTTQNQVAVWKIAGEKKFFWSIFLFLPMNEPMKTQLMCSYKTTQDCNEMKNITHMLHGYRPLNEHHAIYNATLGHA